jgi:hypothetical protein
MMATKTSKRQQTATQPEARDYPQWWDFDTNGLVVEGPFVAAGRGFTAMGERAYITLEVGGELRTVWLHHEVLRLAFAREVARREDRQIHVGESVRIERLAERDSANGRKYVNYDVVFGDSPETTQTDIFGASDVDRAPEAATEEEKGDAWGDDIPFS